MLKSITQNRFIRLHKGSTGCSSSYHYCCRTVSNRVLYRSLYHSGNTPVGEITKVKKYQRDSYNIYFFFTLSYIPGFQMLWASQMRTFWPQTTYEERDISAPWGRLATQQFCGYHHWKDICVGYNDELWLRQRCLHVNDLLYVYSFHVNSPFNQQVPSEWVMRVFGRCGPAVLQQQHQILVLMFENKHLHMHRLAELSHCRRVSRGIERLVTGICR